MQHTQGVTMHLLSYISGISSVYHTILCSAVGWSSRIYAHYTTKEAQYYIQSLYACRHEPVQLHSSICPFFLRSFFFTWGSFYWADKLREYTTETCLESHVSIMAVISLFEIQFIAILTYTVFIRIDYFNKSMLLALAWRTYFWKSFLSNEHQKNLIHILVLLKQYCMRLLTHSLFLRLHVNSNRNIFRMPFFKIFWGYALKNYLGVFFREC